MPYVLWSFWGLAFFFILQQVPQSKSFFTNDLIANYSFAKVLDTLFLNPIPYQLWFLRDLIVFLILWLDLFDNNTVLAGLIHKTSIVFGIMALWSVYDLLMKHKECPVKWLLSISSFSFFLYAAHEPILTMLKKGFIFILGTSQTSSLLAYFLVPLATIFICLTMAYLLKKIAPGFYHILSGGR